VTDVLFAREQGSDVPPNADAVITAEVRDVVARQVEVGVDVVSDGQVPAAALQRVHELGVAWHDRAVST
jgi:hypothetical protein